MCHPCVCPAERVGGSSGAAEPGEVWTEPEEEVMDCSGASGGGYDTEISSQS